MNYLCAFLLFVLLLISGLMGVAFIDAMKKDAMWTQECVTIERTTMPPQKGVYRIRCRRLN